MAFPGCLPHLPLLSDNIGRFDGGIFAGQGLCFGFSFKTGAVETFLLVGFKIHVDGEQRSYPLNEAGCRKSHNFTFEPD